MRRRVPASWQFTAYFRKYNAGRDCPVKEIEVFLREHVVDDFNVEFFPCLVSAWETCGTLHHFPFRTGDRIANLAWGVVNERAQFLDDSEFGYRLTVDAPVSVQPAVERLNMEYRQPSVRPKMLVPQDRDFPEPRL